MFAPICVKQDNLETNTISLSLPPSTALPPLRR